MTHALSNLTVIVSLYDAYISQPIKIEDKAWMKLKDIWLKEETLQYRKTDFNNVKLQVLETLDDSTSKDQKQKKHAKLIR